jgi:hypothetical protein
MMKQNRAIITIKKLQIQSKKTFPLWGVSESNNYIWVIPKSDLHLIDELISEVTRGLK